MTDAEIESLFARIRSFEWDEKKREQNWRAHKVDFQDAKNIFEDYTFARRSDRRGETRYQVFGRINGLETAVACTIREDRCRIISARRARKDERKKYYGGLAGRSSERKD